MSHIPLRKHMNTITSICYSNIFHIGNNMGNYAHETVIRYFTYATSFNCNNVAFTENIYILIPYSSYRFHILHITVASDITGQPFSFRFKLLNRTVKPSASFYQPSQLY